MDKQNICEKIKAILNKVLEGKTLANDDIDFSENMDSIEFVTLVIEIESEFEIEIDDNDFDMRNLSSINKITDLVYSYTQNK